MEPGKTRDIVHLPKGDANLPDGQLGIPPIRAAEESTQASTEVQERSRAANISVWVSVLTLIATGGAAYFTYQQAAEARRQADVAIQETQRLSEVSAQQVILDFASKGDQLGNTDACYRYALTLDDADLRKVFGRRMESISVKPEDAADLKSCLDFYEDIKVLEKGNLSAFRRKTQLKLNSYDIAIDALKTGRANKDEVCTTVVGSLRESADDFINRVYSMKPRAYAFSEEKYWKAARAMAQTADCP